MTVLGVKAGTADGAALAAGTSGNLLNFAGGSDFIATPISGVLEADTGWKVGSTPSMRFTAGTASGVCYVNKTFAAARAAVSMFVALHPESTPSADSGMFYFWAGGARGVTVQFSTANRIVVRDAGSAGGAVLWAPTTVIPNGNTDDYYLRMVFVPHATAGTFKGELWKRGGTAAVESSAALTAKNTGAGTVTQLRVGARTSTGTATTAFTIGLDDLNVDETDQTGFLTLPWRATPTIPASPPQTVGAHVDLSGVVFASGAGTFSASPSDGVVASPAGIFLPTPLDGSTRTYTVTATDTGSGAQASTTVAVAIPELAADDILEILVYNGTAWV